MPALVPIATVLLILPLRTVCLCGVCSVCSHSVLVLGVCVVCGMCGICQLASNCFYIISYPYVCVVDIANAFRILLYLISIIHYTPHLTQLPSLMLLLIFVFIAFCSTIWIP